MSSPVACPCKANRMKINTHVFRPVLGNVTIIDMLGDNKLGVSSPYTTAVTMSAATIGHQSRTIDYADGNIQEFDIYAFSQMLA